MKPIVEHDSGLELAPVPETLADKEDRSGNGAHEDEPEKETFEDLGEAPTLRAESRKRDDAETSARRQRMGVRGLREQARKKSGGGAGQVLGWVLFVAMISGLGGSALTFRQEIIDYLPQSAKHQAADVYDFLGLPFELPGYGLQIEVIQSSRESEDNMPVLVIEGKVTNISRKIRTVPRLRAALRDEESRELQHWFVELSEGKLLSGQATNFRTTVDNPDELAQHLSIKFAGGE